jgi:uncharacterized protein involved in tolerance to divalent cations
MQAESDSPIVVMITAGSRAEAESLAEMLVTRRLAACVQILPKCFPFIAGKEKWNAVPNTFYS